MPDKKPTAFVQVRPFFKRLDVSPSTGWRLIKRGRIKPPLALTEKIRVYPEDYIDEVKAMLLAEREPGE